ncbi:MAG: hypothetical protein HKN88_01605 [Gammaproteobacteria bacterium]|nr:hypothetical protein [Gammaproteobacteria bacterium]NNC96745.1 hypothetical protein [Gammaproteobacteria bacterium]NNM13983.1 hypothetical protein [Gammaproteobacteria bacterium]
MADVKHPILASDGWPFFLGGLFVFLVGFKYGLTWLMLLCLVYFIAGFLLFRDPYRTIPAIPYAVVSPVDGRVMAISVLKEGLLERRAIKLTIRIYKSGAYTTRSPCEGKILSLSDVDLGSRRVDTRGLWIRTDEMDDVVMQMRGEGVAKWYPAVCHVRFGERIGQGERVGLNRLASNCVLYLPETIKLDIAIGQRVKAGSSILAEFDHGQFEEE